MTTEEKKSVEVKETHSPKTSKTHHSIRAFEDMDRFFDHFFPQRLRHPFGAEWPSLFDAKSSLETQLPKVDILDRDTEVIVRAEMPGVDKKDVDVSVTENSISISGKSRHEEKVEEGDYIRSEISSGSFSRTLPLPSQVDANAAKASFNDGLLELTLPKVQKVQRQKISLE